MNLLRKASLNFSSFSLAAMLVMALNHIIGITGLNSYKYQGLFESLASINLLLSFLLVIIFHNPINCKFFLFCAFTFTLGMLAEITGVNTGYPFGAYGYTSVFGWQVCNVPVIIGINWVLLSYVTGVVVNKSKWGEWRKVLAASVLMVLIDLLLERFAIRHHFWMWRDKVPPLQNYLSWFMISIVIQLGFRKLIPDSVNRNAIAYLVILFVFLIADSLVAICT